MNKKIFIVIISLILVGIVGFVLLNANQPSKQEAKSIAPSPALSQIKIAYIDLYKVWEVPISIAIQKELFQKYNLNVNITRTQDSASKLLVAGQVDAIFNAPIPSLLATVEGANLSWVGTILNNTPAILVSNKEPQNIKTVITYPRANPLNKISTTKLLKELNVDINKITFEEVNTEQIALTNLIGKKVDAVGGLRQSSWLVFKQKNKLQEPEPKVLINTQEKESLRTSAGLIVRNDFLKNNKATVENFTKALLEAVSWVRSNRDEAANLLANQLSIKNDEAEIYVDEFITITNKLSFAPNKEEGEKLLEDVKKTNPKAKEFSIDNFISNDVSDSLKNSGFLAQFGFN